MGEERDCESVREESVVFCKYSRKSVRKGCRAALKDFKKVLKTIQEEILGCGFTSSKKKGFALVCGKSLINDLYGKHNVRRDPALEREALSASNNALAAETCRHSTANRCKVITNLMSSFAAQQCYNVLKGISPQIQKRVGCKYIQRGNAALTCVIRRP